METIDYRRVSRDVRRELRFPKRGVRLRRRRPPTTLMPMPEAPMDENHRPSPGEYEIRPTREIPATDAKSISKTVRDAANSKFGRSPYLADRRHVLGASFPRQKVRQNEKLQDRLRKLTLSLAHTLELRTIFCQHFHKLELNQPCFQHAQDRRTILFATQKRPSFRCTQGLRRWPSHIAPQLPPSTSSVAWAG